MKKFLTFIAAAMSGASVKKLMMLGIALMTFSSLFATTRSFTVKQYNTLCVEQGLRVKVSPGAGDTKIVINGEADLVNTIEVKQLNDKLRIYINRDRIEGKRYREVSITVTGPLNSKGFIAESGAQIDVTGFTGDLGITTESGAKVDLDGRVNNLAVSAESGSNVDVEGTVTGHVAVSAESGADVEIEELMGGNISVSTESGAIVELKGSVRNAAMNAEGGSRIKIADLTINGQRTFSSESGGKIKR